MQNRRSEDCVGWFPWRRLHTALGPRMGVSLVRAPGGSWSPPTGTNCHVDRRGPRMVSEAWGVGHRRCALVLLTTWLQGLRLGGR